MNIAIVGSDMLQASPGVSGLCPACLGTVLPYRNPNSHDHYHYRHVVAGDCTLATTGSSGNSGRAASDVAEIPLTKVYGRGPNAIYMPKVMSDRFKALKLHIRNTGDISNLASWLALGKYMFPQQSQAGYWGAMKSYLCKEYNYLLAELDKFNYLTKLIPSQPSSRGN